MKNKLSTLLVLTFFSTLNSQLSTLFAQGTAFTYQGGLNDGASPANGSYDLTFSLWNAASGPAQVGGTLTNSAVGVSNGLFTVSLDFGANFPGANRWLEIGVRTNGGGAFTNLLPRQPITSTPYALRALDAGSAASYAGAISDSQLSANIARLNGSNTFSGTVLFSNPSNTYTGSFTGNGVGVTNILLGTPGLFWPGTFVLNYSPTAGNQPRSVVAADVNSDGKLDLVCVNLGSATVLVLTNNGGGGFVAASTNGVSASPFYVAAADVNGDGKPDVICKSISGGGSFFTVLTNNGSGGLVAALTNSASGGGGGFVAADLNGDGKPDLANAGGGVGLLTVLTNDGSGGFVSASPYGVALFSLTAADVNGDGKLDLIAGSTGGPTGSLSVLTNSGNAVFALASTLSASFTINSVTTADINGDGTPDLICVNNNGTLNVFTNAGSGAFGSPSTNSVGSLPVWVTAVDLNSDGKVDVICANNTSPGKLTALTNNGSGGFVAAFTNSVGNNPFAVIAADLNGDGRQDLVSANSGAGTLSVLFNTPIPSGIYDYSIPISLNNASNSYVGSGAGLFNVPADAITGGLTTNLAVLVPGGLTNTLLFTNGILRGIQ